MALLADYLFDAALAKLDTEANRLDIESPPLASDIETTPQDDGPFVGKSRRKKREEKDLADLNKFLEAYYGKAA